MRALVFGAGGMRIGYHVGVFSGFSQRGMVFDAYLGSSAGALCAAILAQYKSTELANALDHLDNILKLYTSDIWRSWPLGVVSSAWKPGALDSTPLREVIARNIDTKKLRSSGKRLLVCAVDVRTGEPRIFTEQDKDIVKGVQASCSIPAVFNPVNIGGREYWDAATRVVAPVRQAVHLGAEDITVSLLMPATRRYPAAPQNVLESVSRASDISASEILDGDLEETNRITALARAGLLTDKRPILTRVVRPRFELLPDSITSSVEISPFVSGRCFTAGLEDAVACMT